MADIIKFPVMLREVVEPSETPDAPWCRVSEAARERSEREYQEEKCAWLRLQAFIDELERRKREQ